jgi:small subunit ribosomal protein S1
MQGRGQNMSMNNPSSRAQCAMLTETLLDEVFHLDPSQKQEVADLYNELGAKFQSGNVVLGRVLQKDSNGVLVTIEYKSDGLIPNYEFSDFELKKIGLNDQIEVLLDRLEDENGSVVLSYQKAKSLKAWDRISDLAASDEPVRGVVTHKVKGGLSVDIGIPAFLPGSQVDTQRVNNFDQFVGQEIECKILKVNKKRGNVIVSRRKYLEEQRVEEKKKALEVIEEGQVLQGAVKNITNYGVFVDIGGIDGLLHITDMSWGRIAHPSELVKIGDLVTVKIISFDKKHEKISLGMKQLQSNPWEHVENKYAIGKVIKGHVSSITDYGLFVEIEKGIEGLVHISEVSWTERIHNLSKYYTLGQEVEVLVVALDKENRRMSLSIKQMHSDPWKVVAEKFKVGEKITGKVNNITDFGLFVQLHDGVDGLVHISDISWIDHIVHPGDKYKKGDSIEAVILAIDVANKRVSLGIKQLERDPWEKIEEDFPSGKIVEGVVSKITHFGAFVRFSNGVEGLVHISELSNKEVTKVEDYVKLGENRQFKVLKVSKDERKLGLSLRALTEPEETLAQEAAYAQERQQQQQERTVRAEQQQQQQRRAAVQTEESQQNRSQSFESNMKSSLQQALEQHAEKVRDSEKK